MSILLGLLLCYCGLPRDLAYSGLHHLLILSNLDNPPEVSKARGHNGIIGRGDWEADNPNTAVRLPNWHIVRWVWLRWPSPFIAVDKFFQTLPRALT